MQERPIIKVCGMRELDNIACLAHLPIDLMGFIHYPPSPRWVGTSLSAQALDAVLPSHVGRVGVFVDSPIEEVERAALRLGLTHLQLHGHEPIAEVRRMRAQLGLPILKAVGIGSRADIDLALSYADEVEYILLDTKTKAYGGSGAQFDWTLLEHYTSSTPLLLSGGIGVEDAELVRSLQHPALRGVDLNSRFESEPARKDADRLASFLRQLLP